MAIGDVAAGCTVLVLYNGLPLPPSKLSLPTGDLDAYLIHGSLGPPKSTHKGISIGSAVFVGLTIVTDQQTQRQTMLRYL